MKTHRKYVQIEKQPRRSVDKPGYSMPLAKRTQASAYGTPKINLSALLPQPNTSASDQTTVDHASSADKRCMVCFDIDDDGAPSFMDNTETEWVKCADKACRADIHRQCAIVIGDEILCSDHA